MLTAPDITAPTISSVVISGATNALNSTLNTGDVVTATVTMNEAVTVSGSPQLALKIGGTTVQGIYDRVSSTSTALKFNYTILAAQTAESGISLAANSLGLNSGSIVDLAGNAAIITHSQIAENSSYKVDTTAPTIVSTVPIDNASFAFTSNLILNFSESVSAGSGNIILTNLGNSSDTRTIAITDTSQVGFSGSAVTINPTANLLQGAHYAATMSSGVIVDSANNAYAGISSTDVLDFTAVSSANISGHVYHWKSHVLMDTVSVTPSRGSAVSSSSVGHYDLNNLEVGDYTLSASRTTTNDSAGSAITSADALAALKIAVGINPNSDPDGSGPRVAATLSPYQLMAADVTGDGRVTSADALAILKMAVKHPAALTPTWIFADESQVFGLTKSSVTYDVTINKSLTSDLEVNLVALLKGDVNGSWGSKAATSTQVDYSNSSYFSNLATNLLVTQDVWGIS